MQRPSRPTAADRALGLQPFSVVGSTGWVDPGRVDDLTVLADLALVRQLWLHVYGACGVWTRPARAPQRGLSEGMSWLDAQGCAFHKWLHVPYACGLVPIRGDALQRATLTARPAYRQLQSVGLAGGEPRFRDCGTDLSRGCRALKVWAAIQAWGAGALAAATTRKCQLAVEMAAAKMWLRACVITCICVISTDKGLSEAAQSAPHRHMPKSCNWREMSRFP